MAFKRTKKTYDEESLHEYAIGALGRRMRTVAEIKRLMRQRVGSMDAAAAEAMVEAVVARLKSSGYLNDTQYATSYSNLRRENEKFGRMRVVTDLKAKGVHADVIEKTVAEAYGDVDEEKLARDFLARKRLRKPGNEKEAARIFRALARAGFRAAVSVRILKKWDVDDEVLSALEEE